MQVCKNASIQVYASMNACKYGSEYEHQEPAPRRGLAPPVLIFQTSLLCNNFTKIPKFLKNQCQPSHKGLVFGRFLVQITPIFDKPMPAHTNKQL